MRKTKFTRHIEQLGEEDLRQELLELYERLEAVRDYYRMELGTEEERARSYAQVKKEIAAKYKTKSRRRPRRPRIQKVKRLLSGLEKLSVFSHELIDVYLFDVETALDFVREYDYFTQVLYNNITASFTRACELISQNRLWDNYTDRCMVIVQKARYIMELKKNLEKILQSHRTEADT